MFDIVTFDEVLDFVMCYWMIMAFDSNDGWRCTVSRHRIMYGYRKWWLQTEATVTLITIKWQKWFIGISVTWMHSRLTVWQDIRCSTNYLIWHFRINEFVTSLHELKGHSLTHHVMYHCLRNGALSPDMFLVSQYVASTITSMLLLYIIIRFLCPSLQRYDHIMI